MSERRSRPRDDRPCQPAKGVATVPDAKGLFLGCDPALATGGFELWDFVVGHSFLPELPL
jgi:hypothetical protein